MHYAGQQRYSHQNPNMWWFILAAANGGALLFLIMLVATQMSGLRMQSFLVGVIVWTVTNAVLVPIAITQMRKQLVIDFDRGVIAVNGIAYPATEFLRAAEVTRYYPGQARMLVLVYQRGAVEMQIDGFTQSPALRERNEALLHFVYRWLPIPEQYRSRIETGPMRVQDLVGRQEILALLRGV